LIIICIFVIGRKLPFKAKRDQSPLPASENAPESESMLDSIESDDVQPSTSHDEFAEEPLDISNTEPEDLLDIASFTPPPSTTPEPQHLISIRDEVFLAVKDILKGDECQNEIEELTEALSTKISLKVKALSEAKPSHEDKPTGTWIFADDYEMCKHCMKHGKSSEIPAKLRGLPR
jgi:hypothetical protein